MFSKKREVIRKTHLFIEAIDKRNNATVLDLGCGTGEFAYFIREKTDALVIGIDPDSKKLRYGKKFNINLIQAVGENLPFRNQYFNGIFINEVLEHVRNDEEVLNEVHRVLRDGGLLYVAAPNKFCPLEQHGMHVGSTHVSNLWDYGMPFLSWMPTLLRKRLANARIYDVKKLTKMICAHGFNILEIGFVMPVLDKLRASERTKDIIRTVFEKLEQIKFIRAFALSIEILARKP